MGLKSPRSIVTTVESVKLRYMIVLVTDFGVSDLFHDAAVFRPMSMAYLLPAYIEEFPQGTVFLCVVDPGVGSSRRPAAVCADGRWFVGPDNGLFNEVARRAIRLDWWDITWQPEHLSASFHGRDLFAHVAASLANGLEVPGESVDPAGRIHADWPRDLLEVVYIDHFGNAITGARIGAAGENRNLRINGHVLARARTFSDVPKGDCFWYENANGLIEIAANRTRADVVLKLEIGMAAEVVCDGG